MKLNDKDARAVDIVLGGMQNTGQIGSSPAQTFGTGSLYAGSGSTGAVNPMTANNDLAGRVTHADDLLRLLDYLPADEPPANLLQQTLQRVQNARSGHEASARQGQFHGIGEPPQGFSQARVAHSPTSSDDPAAG